MKYNLFTFSVGLSILLGGSSFVGAGPVNPSPKTPKAYDYAEVLHLSLLFYEAQRCGRLGGDNRIPWRGNSFLNDVDGDVDLRGGYFDAGDHVKFGFPQAGFATIIGWGLVDYKTGYELAGEYENGLAAMRWVLDYLMKAHPAPNVLYAQVGSGPVDHAYWGRPEDWPMELARPAYKITAEAPGSDLAAETAAAFATGYLIFKERNPSYAVECLRHAEELYEFANNYRGRYHESIPEDTYSSYEYGDELAWGAAWLYRATNDEKYLADVRSHWEEFGLDYEPHNFDWDSKTAGLQVLMAKVTHEPVYMNAARRYCDWIVYEAPRTPLNLTYLNPWGSLRHVGNAVFACLQAADAGVRPDAYREYALQQFGYILGDTGRSFVIGYGVNPPQRPHHRASSCPDRPAPCGHAELDSPDPSPQVLYGALVGGPDEDDFYEDRRDDYVKNEVAIDYNAGFQSALAGLVQFSKANRINSN